MLVSRARLARSRSHPLLAASELTKRILALLVLIAAGCFLALRGASVLVVNDPVKSEVILVLAGDRDDSRFWYAVKLVDEGFAPRLVLDVHSPGSQFGVSDTDLARAFVTKNAPDRATVCEVFADSTFGETVDVARCLQPLPVSSVLIVTSAYHSRRALTIFQRRLPQYQWHVAALGGPTDPGTPWVRTADQWWKHRRWAKTVVDEWQKWVWWFLVDRWRAHPVSAS